MEFLRDSIWQFIGATLSASLAVLAMFQAYYFFGKTKSKKSLKCTLLYSYTHETMPQVDQIQTRIFFKDKMVKSASVLIYQIINSGDLPIEAKDYESPIVFSYLKDCNILFSEI